MNDARLDPVTLSVLTSALAGIAEEMGALLIHGAYSSNIKERHDCSAALFDADGGMVAQAEHIPVHLGAMPESVAAVIERGTREQLEPGEVFVLNDPYAGGTHLPDITLVSPFAIEDELAGYAVTRAHHSDVGGMRPGSMPSDSRELYQEGLVIPPVRLARAGEYVPDVLDLMLANVRTPDVRRGDLRAQLAANELAQRRIGDLAARRGADTLRAAFAETIAYAERGARAAIAALPDGRYEADGEIEGDGVSDEDVPLAVAVEIAGEGMTIDFEGSAPQVAGNVNCPLAVTRSACYFALRVLLDVEIPTNSGAYRPLEIRAPAGSVVNALKPAAVVAGNVETSQRIADTVLAALGRATELPAAGQGTMNNVVIGGSRAEGEGDWTYYETIGGGQGAGPGGPGPSGVHVGMSNTLNTPIEALELEYPLRIERYELRYGSGGDGNHRGGDGVVRGVRALEPASLSLLSDRRRHGPAGAAGGSDGEPGENLLNGEPLAPKASRELASGDVVEVRTPGTFKDCNGSPFRKREELGPPGRAGPRPSRAWLRPRLPRVRPVEIHDLHKRFGSVEAVKGLSFGIDAGRVTGFLGPNGAGKSTTIRALLGLVHPTSGTALFGERRYDQIERPTTHIGVVLEDAGFHPGRTARNHLRVLAATGEHPPGRVEEVLATVGLTEAADRLVKGYSMGMRQRLAIASALLGDPEVLILDEPTNGLDPPGIAWMRGLLRHQADQGRAVLVSSHLLAEVAQSVDDVVVIANGELRGAGTLEQVLGGDEGPVAVVRANDLGPLRAALEQAGHEVVPEDDRLVVPGSTPEEVGLVAHEAQLALTGLGTRSRSLEAAFLALTGGQQ